MGIYPFISLFLFPSSCSWAGLSFYFHVLWVMGSLDKIRNLCCLLLLMAFSWQFTAKLLASSLHEFQAPRHCSFQRTPKLGRLPVDQIFISWNVNQACWNKLERTQRSESQYSRALLEGHWTGPVWPCLWEKVRMHQVAYYLQSGHREDTPVDGNCILFKGLGVSHTFQMAIPLTVWYSVSFSHPESYWL